MSSSKSIKYLLQLLSTHPAGGDVNIGGLQPRVGRRIGGVFELKVGENGPGNREKPDGKSGVFSHR